MKQTILELINKKRKDALTYWTIDAESEMSFMDGYNQAVDDIINILNEYEEMVEED